MIQLLFFGRYQDDLDSSGEQVELPGNVDTISRIRNWLAARGPDWAAIFGPENTLLLAAVNQEMAEQDTPIKDGDEVAFFPPVTGG